MAIETAFDPEGVQGLRNPFWGIQDMDRWSKWLEAAKQRPSVVETTSEAQHYQQILERYANNTAQSEAARETRAGRSFH